jgi:hypothetical protein
MSAVVLRSIRDLDRSPRLLWALLLLIALAGFLIFPLPPENLVSLARSAFGSGEMAERIFSIVQDRPFETNTRFAERFDRIHRDLEDKVRATPGGLGVLRVIKIARLYDRSVVPLFLSPEPDAWQENLDYHVWYQVLFARCAPVAWLMETSHLSTVWIVLSWHVAGWLGFLSLFLTIRRLIGSSLLALACLAGSYILVRWLNLPLPPSVLNLFTVIYIGQMLADRNWPRGVATRRYRLLAEVALVLALGAEGVFTLLTPPLQNNANCLIVAGLPILMGLLTLSSRGSRSLVLRGVAALVVLFLVQRPYDSYCASICAPVSSVNHGRSQAYTLLMLWLGSYERPTWLGTPNGDIAFDWALRRDPLLYGEAPWLVVHQGFPSVGRDLVIHTLRHRPLLLVDAVWKRVAMQILRFESLNFQSFGDDRSSLLQFKRESLRVGLVLVLVLFVWLAGLPAPREAAWPPLAVLLWQCLGINSLFTMVHTHQWWQEQGFEALGWLLPTLVLFTALHFRALVCRPGKWLIAHRTLRLVQIGALGIALGTGVVGRFVWHETAKEWHAMNTWLAIHFGQFYPDFRRTKAQLLEEFQAMKELGDDEPGSVDMFAAQHFSAYFYTSDPEAKTLAREFYRRALRAAPDNPNYSSFATLIEHPDWPTIYARTLGQFPDHPYAAYMAFRLFQHGALQQYGDLYEEKMGQLWARTAHLRPGYARLPDLGRQQVDVHTAADGLVVVLPPHQNLRLPDFRTYGSSQAGVVLFVKVSKGSLVAYLENAAGETVAGSMQPVFAPRDLTNYRTLAGQLNPEDAAAHVVLEASDQGARFILRDYYPLLRAPRFFRRGQPK